MSAVERFVIDGAVSNFKERKTPAFIFFPLPSLDCFEIESVSPPEANLPQACESVRDWCSFEGKVSSSNKSLYFWKASRGEERTFRPLRLYRWSCSSPYSVVDFVLNRIGACKERRLSRFDVTGWPWSCSSLFFFLVLFLLLTTHSSHQRSTSTHGRRRYCQGIY